VADGELLEDSKSIIFSYDKDLSLRPGPDLLHMRFLEADIVHVKEGHIKEFRELAKMWSTVMERRARPSTGMLSRLSTRGAGYFVFLTATSRWMI